MTKLISSIFKVCVETLAAICFFMSIVLGFIMIFGQNDILGGFLFLIGGPILTSIAFGTLFLMLENNRLLESINNHLEGKSGVEDQASITSEYLNRHYPT